MATNAELIERAMPAPAKKPRQGRSPAFPFVPLNKALEKAEALRVAEGGRPKHYSPLPAIAKAWDMGEKTGPMKQTVAALGHFGLFEFEGSGEKRAARLTDAALRILLDKQPVSVERDALIQRIALLPTVHKELWDKWQTALPSDPTLETYLVRDRGFSEGGAKDLMAEYKATLAFAKMAEPANIPDGIEEDAVDISQELGETGQQIQRHKGSQKDKAKLMAHERELTAGLLSKDANFRLIVSGPIGVKEIERLIKKLEFDKDILAEQSENNEAAN
jgi:hypothetical protein